MGAEKYMELIRAEGYEAFDQHGVIYAVIPDEEYFGKGDARAYKKLCRLRQEAGYNASWGVMPKSSYKPSKGENKA